MAYGTTTSYFSAGSGAPTTAPTVPAGEYALYQNTANGDLYEWNLSGTPGWTKIYPGAGGGALGNASNFIASNVSMASANTYYDGPSVSLAAGTWLIIATAGLINSGGTGLDYTTKLWDGGSNVYASGEETRAGGGFFAQVTVSAIVTLTSTTTVKYSAAATVASSTMYASALNNATGIGNVRSGITAVQIA